MRRPELKRSAAALLAAALLLLSSRHAEAQATPVAPSTAVLTATDGAIQLSWSWASAPTLTRSEVQCRSRGAGSGAGAWPAAWTHTTASARTYSDSSAANDNIHQCRVRGHYTGSSGAATVSNEAMPVSRTAPAAPSSVTPVPGDETIQLSWVWTGTLNADVLDGNPSGDGERWQWEYRTRQTGGSFGAWVDSGASPSSRSFTATSGFSNYVSYEFQVRAVRSIFITADTEPGAFRIEGLPSPTSRPATPAPGDAPPAPFDVQARAGDGSINIQWSWSGPSGITGWQYQIAAGTAAPSAWTTLPNAVESSRQGMIGGLMNGTPYTVRLRADAGGIVGLASAWSTAATPHAQSNEVPGAPPAPTVIPANREATVSWTSPPPIECCPITFWQIGYRVIGATNYSWFTVPNSGPTTTSYTLTGLTPGASYIFIVRAANSNGVGHRSPQSQMVTIPDTTAVPGQPGTPTAVAEFQEVTVSWSPAPPVECCPVTLWEVGYRRLQETAYTWVQVPDSRPDTTSYTLIGLTVGDTYVFIVRATNRNGVGKRSRQSNSVQVTGAGPAPEAPTAYPVNQGIRMTWKAVDTAPPATSYEYRILDHHDADGGADWTPAPGGAGPTFNVHHLNLENGHTYSAQVRAISDYGPGPPSPWSNRVTAGPIRPLIEIERIEPIGRGLLVHWREIWPSNPPLISLTYEARPAEQEEEASGTTSRMRIENPRSPLAIKGLTPERPHTVQFRGANIDGNGPWSQPVMGIPALGAQVHFSNANPLNLHEHAEFTLEVTTTRAPDSATFPVTLTAFPPGIVGLGPHGADTVTVTLRPPTARIDGFVIADEDHDDETADISITSGNPEYEVGPPAMWRIYVVDQGDGTAKTIEIADGTPTRVMEGEPFDITLEADPPIPSDARVRVQLSSDRRDKLVFGPEQRAVHAFYFTGPTETVTAFPVLDADAEDVRLKVRLQTAGDGYVPGENNELELHISDPGDTTPVPVLPTPLLAALAALLTALGARRVRRNTVRG